MKRKAPEKPKRPVKPAPHAVQEQEIQIDTDRWSGFRDSFGEREVGIDGDGSPIELLRLAREFTAVEQAIADRLARLAGADHPGIARPLRLEHDDLKRRPRLVLVSERIAGVRLSEAMARGISRRVVPDIGAALYVMRRLFTAAESLHVATGVSHLIIAPERIILTPRADIFITEAALAGGVEVLATLPRALQLALADVSGPEEAHRVDIARIARIGISMTLGRMIEPNETVDALSPTLNEIADVASIRAGDAFAVALRAWIEQAVTIDASVSFASFRQAGEALARTDPPRDCAPSRRTLKTFLNDLVLEDLGSPETAALETDRMRAIRARQTASRPVHAPSSMWDSLAPELGLARRDEILQESLEEIELNPLDETAEEWPDQEPARERAGQEEVVADEIDMSEAVTAISVDPGISAADEPAFFEIGEPIGELSVESFEIASAAASPPVEPEAPPVAPPVPTTAPPPAAPPKDLVLSVASRFGFLLREEPGQRRPVQFEPPPRGEVMAAPVAREPEAAPTPSVAQADVQESTAADPVFQEAPALAAAEEHEEPAHTAEPAHVEVHSGWSSGSDPESAAHSGSDPEFPEPPSWTPPPIEPAEAVAPKRQKRSWFRTVAKQFGMGDEAGAIEAAPTNQPAEDSLPDRFAADEGLQVAEEAERMAAESESRRLFALGVQSAAEAEEHRLAADEDEKAQRVIEAQKRGAADAEARRIAAEEEDEGQRFAEAQSRAEHRRMAAEDEAGRQAAELEARLQAVEAQALREAEDETRRLLEEAEARRRAEEETQRLAAKVEARRLEEEEATRHAEAEACERQEEAARQRAEDEARRLAAEAEARQRAEDEARRLAAEAEAKRRAEEEATRRAEAEARQREEQATRRRAEEETRRLAAEAEAGRRAEEDAKRRAEAEARQRAEEARQREEQEARRRAADEARRIEAEAEVARLAAIVEEARRAAAEAEAHRLAADDEAQRLADEDEELEEEEPVEPGSRATWLNSVASEMGLKSGKTPAETSPPVTPSSEQTPTRTWRPPAVTSPAEAQSTEQTPSRTWRPPAVTSPAETKSTEQTPTRTWRPPVLTPPPANAPQPTSAWQTHEQLPTATTGQPQPIDAPQPAAVYEPAPKPAKKPRGSSRLPEIAAAVSQVMRSAALLVVAVGIVGGLVWGGYSYYSTNMVPGTVVIESNPTGAEILIDGAAKGVTPLTIALPPGQHKLELRRRGNSRELTLDIAAGEQLRQQIDLTNLRALGTLVVNSSPNGAKVLVDGTERGVTPLTLTDIATGGHTVTIESNAGSVQKNVHIEAGEKVTIDEGIFSGWIAVFAPFELEIFERKRLIGTTENERIMLAAGRHELEFVNTRRGFRYTRLVEVAPGATVPVNIQESETTGIVRIEAPAGTEIFIDGNRVGESPLAEQRVTVGTREILARHSQFGDRKATATVSSSTPAEVKIEFEPPL